MVDGEDDELDLEGLAPDVVTVCRWDDGTLRVEGGDLDDDEVLALLMRAVAVMIADTVADYLAGADPAGEDEGGAE
jgi:hypothetical protein